MMETRRDESADETSIRHNYMHNGRMRGVSFHIHSEYVRVRGLAVSTRFP